MAIDEEFQTDQQQGHIPGPLDSPSASEQSLFSVDETPSEREYPADPPPLTFIPDSLAETTRKSGLAWSAGIVFFASIAFMLVLGWFADLLLGSAPWGIVVGIILGSIIGFLQFFRITSQILAKPTSETPPRTLMTDRSDDPYA